MNQHTEKLQPLSKRLQAVADVFPTGNRIVDVGTDHGYIPIYLVQASRSPGGIAADINAGPLERAREHIARAGLSEDILTVLSNGLHNIEPPKDASLVVAGMGGRLMWQILTDRPEVTCRFQKLILEPQSDLEFFRHSLFAHGFVLEAEDMVKEDGKYYPIMRVAPPETFSPNGAAANTASMDLVTANETIAHGVLGVLEERYGPLLLRAHHPVLFDFLKKEQAEKEKVLAQIGRAEAKRQGERIVSLERAHRMAQIKEDLILNGLAQQITKGEQT